MVLKDLLAISGHGGLFRFISQGRNGIIVESLENGKRMNASATAKVSSLEDIAIYTEDEEVSLAQVFDNIYEKENGGEAISHKSSSDELKNYMEEILPAYDKDRVYVSDIKKLLNWYNQLQSGDLLVKEDPKEKEATEEEKATEDKASAKADKKEEKTEE